MLQLGLQGIGVPADEHRATLELFLDRVAPVLRAQLPSRVLAGHRDQRLTVSLTHLRDPGGSACPLRTDPSPPARRATGPVLCVVGAGPTAVGVLERLAANAPSSPEPAGSPSTWSTRTRRVGAGCGGPRSRRCCGPTPGRRRHAMPDESVTVEGPVGDGVRRWSSGSSRWAGTCPR